MHSQFEEAAGLGSSWFRNEVIHIGHLSFLVIHPILLVLVQDSRFIQLKIAHLWTLTISVSDRLSL